jgi:hypothetical protein
MSRKHSPGPTPDIIHPAHSTKKVGYVPRMWYFYGFQQYICLIIGFPLKYRVPGNGHCRHIVLSVANTK